jgi:hypothetical protein
VGAGMQKRLAKKQRRHNQGEKVNEIIARPLQVQRSVFRKEKQEEPG